MSIETRKGNITLYAAGGCGINIAKLIEPFRKQAEPGMATINPVYIDTSKSNAKAIPPEHTWLFDGMDGSGKVRAENYGEITKHVRSILQKFPAGDLAIVLSSAHGGSGSVIAPSLVSELLEAGTPVIVLTVGGTESALEIKNSLNTIKSYEGVAQKRECHVVMGYFQNSKQTPRPEVDRNVVEMITSLMVFFSRENSELDSKDLANFLRFDKVAPNYKSPRLVGLVRYLVDQTNDIDDVTTGNVVGMVSLLRPAIPQADGKIEPAQTLDLNFIPDYQSNGYLPPDIHSRLLGIAPLTLVTLANTPQAVAKDLNGRLAAIDKAQKARVDSGPVLTDKDKPTDTGLVL